jgi:methionine biosynthesis protein MetW
VRLIYRTLIPLSIRSFLWRVRNVFSHAVSERLPVAPVLEYEGYWRWRASRGSLAMTHPELVEMCASLMPEHARVLDIGCGSGDFLLALQTRKNVSVIGVDVSEQAVALARQKGLDARVLNVARPFELPEKIDFVILFEVIEHLPDPEQLLLNLKSLRCRIIVSIPNTGYIASRLRLLLGRFPRQWIYHPGEHLRYWTLRDFRVMSAYLGFEIEQVIPLKGFVSLSRYSPGLFAEYLVFVLAPNP